MAEAGHVELSVYDTSGRRVARLASETYGAGDHTVTWEGRDDSGRAMASGTYFVQMKTGSVYQQQKVNLIK
jgi:flagellar hook assembly protein FlgD